MSKTQLSISSNGDFKGTLYDFRFWSGTDMTDWWAELSWWRKFLNWWRCKRNPDKLFKTSRINQMYVKNFHPSIREEGLKAERTFTFE